MAPLLPSPYTPFLFLLSSLGIFLLLGSVSSHSFLSLDFEVSQDLCFFILHHSWRYLLQRFLYSIQATRLWLSMSYQVAVYIPLLCAVSLASLDSLHVGSCLMWETLASISLVLEAFSCAAMINTSVLCFGPFLTTDWTLSMSVNSFISLWFMVVLFMMIPPPQWISMAWDIHLAVHQWEAPSWCINGS